MLTIIHNSKDISREQARYEFLPSVIDFNNGDLLIGYYKPISYIYLNQVSVSEERNITVKYYNGISFDNVSGLIDLSFGLNKPGFISWNKNQITEKKSTLEAKELYWYKINVSVPGSVTLKGVSAVFSDDYDLEAVYPTIKNHLPEGQDTFVRFHEEAAKDIINDLKRTGIVINGILQNGKERKQLDAFDLHDKEEVRDASKLFTLAKIFFWLSDAPGDKWEVLAAKYEADAAGSLTPLISIDQDDDGLKDEDEDAQDVAVYIGRL
jgi:hypothetical protein